MSHYIAEGQVNDTSKKALGTIQILRKGIPFIYQGQEIGMENQVFESVEDFDDIATINGYHVAKEAGLSEEEAWQQLPTTAGTMHGHPCSGQQSQVWALAMEQPG